MRYNILYKTCGQELIPAYCTKKVLSENIWTGYLHLFAYIYPYLMLAVLKAWETEKHSIGIQGWNSFRSGYNSDNKLPL